MNKYLARGAIYGLAMIIVMFSVWFALDVIHNPEVFKSTPPEALWFGLNLLVLGVVESIGLVWLGPKWVEDHVY